MAMKLFGIYLLQKGAITREQLLATVKLQTERAGRLGDCLVTEGAITGAQLAEMFGEFHAPVAT